MNPKIAKLLATNHHAAAKFMRTGRLPEVHVADSPLIRLLLKIGKGNLHLFRGVTVDESLGYLGRRTFPTAGAALNWLQPPSSISSNHPAESWRIKQGPGRELTLEDLLAKCAGKPPAPLLDRLKHLQAPSSASLQAQAAPESDPGGAPDVDLAANSLAKPGNR